MVNEHRYYQALSAIRQRCYVSADAPPALQSQSVQYTVTTEYFKRCAEAYLATLHSQFLACSLQCSLPETRPWSTASLPLCAYCLLICLAFRTICAWDPNKSMSTLHVTIAPMTYVASAVGLRTLKAQRRIAPMWPVLWRRGPFLIYMIYTIFFPLFHRRKGPTYLASSCVSSFHVNNKATVSCRQILPSWCDDPITIQDTESYSI